MYAADTRLVYDAIVFSGSEAKRKLLQCKAKEMKTGDESLRKTLKIRAEPSFLSQKALTVVKTVP